MARFSNANPTTLRNQFMVDFATVLHIPPPVMDELKLRDFASLALWCEQEAARRRQQRDN